LSLLQDRVAQAGVLAEFCRSTLAVIHKVMFPLNDQPGGLPSLLERFENGEAMYHFVHQHLLCGAQVALSFVRDRHPEVDMEAVVLCHRREKVLPKCRHITMLIIKQQELLHSRLLPKVIGKGRLASPMSDVNHWLLLLVNFSELNL
jgi:hypothetical protein